MNKFFSRFKKSIFGSGLEEKELFNGSEMECLTLQLIQETEAALLESFQQSIADYEDLSQSPKNNTGGAVQSRTLEHKILDEDMAKRILATLLKEAVASRKMLAVRVEHDIETGMLFNRYYRKMQTINDRTIEAYEKLQIMDRDKDAFEYKQAVYKKLTGRLYQPDTIPGDTDSTPDGSSPAHAVDAREAISASKRVSRRWDVLELLNLRKSVRLSKEETQRAAEDYLAQQDTESARTKEAKEAECARKEQAEAEERTFLAKAAAEAARMKEAIAAEKAARAGVSAEKARTAEAQAEAEAARAKAEAETEAAQIKADQEVVRAKAEANAAQIKAERAQVKAEAEVRQAEVEAAAAQTKAESAQAKTEAEVRQAEAEAAAARTKAEAAQTQTEAEVRQAGAETTAARAKAEAAQAKAEAEVQRAKAETTAVSAKAEAESVRAGEEAAQSDMESEAEAAPTRTQTEFSLTETIPGDGSEDDAAGDDGEAAPAEENGTGKD